MIEIRSEGPVRVLTLSSGRVNALDVELLEELTNAVGRLESSGGTPSRGPITCRRSRPPSLGLVPWVSGNWISLVMEPGSSAVVGTL